VFTNERVLAIDTSTEQAGIAVRTGEQAVELRWTSGREQTTSVLDQIDRCLNLAAVRTDQLTAIAIATGPGMFNGLRVGISLAKGFALSLGVPIVGVSTLEITARPWLGLGFDVVPVVTAGRGRVVWSRVRRDAVSVEAPSNTTVEELTERIHGMENSPLVAGEFPEERIGDLLATGAIVRAGSAFARSPIDLVRLALARLDAGEQDDLVTLEPVYVHGRSAVTRR
jgi:tRNA threonylcarbamoyladenosine biosynthesis protein TsaB